MPSEDENFEFDSASWCSEERHIDVGEEKPDDPKIDEGSIDEASIPTKL